SYFDLNARNRSAEIGYLIAPESRGKGLGREAVGLLLQFLFNGLGLNKVYAQTGAFNIPSIRLLETLGFQRDAVLREHHLYEGRLHDDYVYSLLVREWRERRGAGDPSR
ncbi:MAG: GNAT family N-acetyltransferase, partial [Candidatus Eisenbacteria bacterium]|nr:GNAT family N-acetyltransferase [Candidatus Latescibacterota bacterium]MBD3301147.1 GNAT family N-acetyltransferase [Candidatus Eisenbacteria bacterium]